MDVLPPLKCNGCTVCCQGDTIYLQPGDDPAQYKTKLVNGQRVLAKRKDGNCVYLTKRGCSIHNRQPQECRRFDCRVYAQDVAKLPRVEQLKRSQGRPARVIIVGLTKLREIGIEVVPNQN